MSRHLWCKNKCVASHKHAHIVYIWIHTKSTSYSSNFEKLFHMNTSIICADMRYHNSINYICIIVIIYVCIMRFMQHENQGDALNWCTDMTRYDQDLCCQSLSWPAGLMGWRRRHQHPCLLLKLGDKQLIYWKRSSGWVSITANFKLSSGCIYHSCRVFCILRSFWSQGLAPTTWSFILTSQDRLATRTWSILIPRKKPSEMTCQSWEDCGEPALQCGRRVRTLWAWLGISTFGTAEHIPCFAGRSSVFGRSSYRCGILEASWGTSFLPDAADIECMSNSGRFGSLYKSLCQPIEYHLVPITFFSHFVVVNL